MAAVNPNKGSWAGLVTAVVIFVILFVVSTIYAIYYNAQWTKSQLDADRERTARAQFVNDADLTNPDIQNYVKLAHKPKAAINAVMDERDQLSRFIAGSPEPTSKVADDVTKTLAYASDRLTTAKIQSVTVSADLNTTVRNLADAVVTIDSERTKAQADAAASAAAAVATTNERDGLLKKKDDDIAAVTADKDKAVAEIEDWRKAKGGDIDQIKADADQKIKDLQAAADKLQVEINKRDADLKDKIKLTEALENRLRTTRVNTNEPIIQQADGKLLRIPSQDTVFINIGQQQSVTLGLTFEVYDQYKGIPALGDGMRDADLPEGKASIEVIHVLPTTSECRVIHRALGETLTEGDLIMNLVYDPNAHYKFMVYGNFDMSNEGTATPADADVIKRLITQWGGRLVNTVDVSTDFVVLGSEPDVPVLSKEDENDPVKEQRRDAQQAALDAYLDVQSKAVELGIPIMNQNRFLYFVGYYDQANR
jgi:hypothetical protein